MDGDPVKQFILVMENYLSQTGFGEEGLRRAQDRGWLDKSGCATDEGKRLFFAVASQVGTRSVFRNMAVE